MPKGENFKHTFEHVKNVFEERGYTLLSTEYNSYKDKLDFMDGEGYIYRMGFTIFRTSERKLHKFHTNNIHTLHNLKLWMTKNNMNIEILTTEYKRNSQKLLLKTKEGCLAYSTLDKLTQGNTPYIFDKRNEHTIHNIKIWVKNNSPTIELISDVYFDNTSMLKFKCKKENCNELFESSWNCVSSGRKCPYCAGKRAGKSNSFVSKNPHILKEWHPDKNKKLDLHSLTYGSRKLAWWVCSKCGHEWETAIKERSMGRGCPICNVSYGENMVFNILNSYEVGISPQHKFKGCTYIGQLRFDFYIPSHRVAIEVQGRQHYMPIDFSGRGEESALTQFEEQKIKDQIKRDYCKNNDIKLIEIPYWDFDNMENTIVEGLELKPKIKQYIIN